VIALHATQHNARSDHVQLCQCILAKFRIVTSDWIQQLLVENRNVLRGTMIASNAHVIIIGGPVQLLTVAGTTEVVCKRSDL
jgi:hypothetical protein